MNLGQLVRERIIKQANETHVTKFRSVSIDVSRLRTAKLINVELFDGQQIQSLRTKIIRRSETDFTWFGDVIGDINSKLILTVVNDHLSGHLNISATIYQLLYMGEDVYSLRKTSQTSLPREGQPVEIDFKTNKPLLNSIQTKKKNEADQFEKAVSASYGNDETMVDIMVLYTADAASSVGDIKAEIQNGIDVSNRAYEVSQVNHRLRLAHTELVSYTESGSSSSDLSRVMSKTDGIMDSIHDLRTAKCADLVSLWVKSSDACGLASLITEPTNASAEQYGFSVVDIDCAVGNYSFPHEVGHNLGSRHDIGVDAGTTPYTYSHGKVHNTFYRTIMAYDTTCGGGCSRVGYFSNPSVSYMGLATGDATANNALSMNNTSSSVAKFRADTCSTIDVDNEDVEIDSLIGTDCFIATATYGSVYHPLVQSLRDFRDQFLLNYRWGKKIVIWYYMFSPPLAKLVSQYSWLKSIALFYLTPLILLISFPIWSLVVINVTFLFAIIILAVVVRRKALR